MENPFKLQEAKLKELISRYTVWLNSSPNEKKYPEINKNFSEKIKKEFLNKEVLSSISDDDLFKIIFDYSRKLEGPVHIRLGKERISSNLKNIKRNLKYILDSEDEPAIIAEKILDSDLKIPVFSKAFWSPIFQAQFPEELPNWNNKTEKCFRNMGINISTSTISTSEKYRILSNAFRYMSSLNENMDFYKLNHLMHFGTVVKEGIEIINPPEPDPVEELIRKYKHKIKQIGLSDELYKWKILKKHQDKPNLNANDFFSEIKSIDMANLAYPMAVAVRNHIAEKRPEEFRECFRKLFDEEEDLISRINAFITNVLEVYRTLEPSLGHHHDERTIATYLTYYKPDKYTFYKNSFYKKYCSLIDVKSKPRGEKYAHFLELVNDLIEQYILPDNELLELVKGNLTSECFQDESHMILAQDILYQMLDTEIGIEKSYWRVGTTDDNKSHWEYMKNNGHVCIGWSELGDLSKLEDSSIDVLKKALVEKGFYTGNKGLLTQKAGELFSFLNEMKAGDVVVAQVGKSVLGIGILTDEEDNYFFKSEIEFSHHRNIDWKLFEPDISNEDGLLKTVYKIKDKNMISQIENLLKSKKTSEPPLNQIFFGPPGTGKTYYTVNEAVKIVDREFYSANKDKRENLQARFNELLIKDWNKIEGQISFCTFHQSFSYEDFVEGIKPMKPDAGDTYLKYTVERGIFYNICRIAKARTDAQIMAKENRVSFSQDEYNKAIFYKISLGDSTKVEEKEIYEYCANNDFITIGFGESIDFTGKNEAQVIETVKAAQLPPFHSQAMNLFKNYLKTGNYVVVSFGNSYIRALGEVTGEYEYNPEPEIPYEHFRKVRWIFKDVEIPVGEFYKKNLSQQTIYKLNSEFIIPEFFLKSGQQSGADKEQKKFVLIIDEINRGNVSSIFGELITLIEPNKRAGLPEALEVVLPYSKERFAVPSNVYIIGTMNTADRSIEALDTALRRRFSFRCLEPNPGLISQVGKSKGMVDGINLVEMLEKMNERIEKLIDKDHKIGHSYFLDAETLKDLKRVFNDKVIPLLEEYFFGDFGKIGLVLGQSFVRKDDMEAFEFAGFEDYDSQTRQDLKQRSVFKIRPSEDWDYRSIYETTGGE